jgi:energy-coupling factor transporter ATP-binding protein EcfA2
MVDPIMSDHLSDLMLRLKRQLNLTSVVVTHDLDLMSKVADRVVSIQLSMTTKSGAGAFARLKPAHHAPHSLGTAHLGIPDPLDFPERKGRSISHNGRAARFLRGQAPKGARPTSRSGSGGGCCLNREAHRLYSREVCLGHRSSELGSDEGAPNFLRLHDSARLPPGASPDASIVSKFLNLRGK